MTLEELGALLRAERERRCLNIEDVSAHLKISVRKLRALEEGDASSMPLAYAKGFVRSYATYLGMAASEVVEAMQVVSSHLPENTEETVRPARHAPPPDTAPRKGGSGVFVRLLLLTTAAAALAGGSYAVWKSGFLETLHGRQNDVARPALPLRDEARPAYVPAPAPSESAAPAPVAVPAPPAPPATPQAPPSATASPSPATPEKVVVRTGDAASAAAPAARDDGFLPPGQHKIVITATETCWIRSTADRTDTRQFSLGKGDTFALTFSQRLDLRLGNAGGVRIRYDGKDFPTGARSGQARTLVFPPKN